MRDDDFLLCFVFAFQKKKKNATKHEVSDLLYNQLPFIMTHDSWFDWSGRQMLPLFFLFFFCIWDNHYGWNGIGKFMVYRWCTRMEKMCKQYVYRILYHLSLKAFTVRICSLFQMFDCETYKSLFTWRK